MHTEPKRPVNNHKAYHAHIYFDAETLALAERLAAESGSRFGLQVGRIHQRLVGPHPCWSVQIIFSHKDFDGFISWLDLERQGLSVLVHAQTGDDLKDHTDYAYWLGDSVPLKLDMFR
ncbi:MAG: DOPA 4,5-dioxygenase family protein [Amphritea sp.]|nr:DOPA 4,5-dioxygenase family protein [Amphritea sp.]